MKHVLATSLMVICLALRGSEGPRDMASSVSAAQDYPHAFPREGTEQLFDNERVTAWHVRWLKGVPQPFHRHRFDMAGVYLRYGPIRVTSVDGTASPVGAPFVVPRPYFQRKDITHREEAVGFGADAPEREAVMLDLKDGSFPPVARPGVAAAFPRDGVTPAIDNDRVVEWDYTWQPGRAGRIHVHDKDSVEVFFDGGRIQYKRADGKAEEQTVERGSVRFIPRGTVDAETAVDGTPRAVIVELK